MVVECSSGNKMCKDQGEMTKEWEWHNQKGPEQWSPQNPNFSSVLFFLYANIKANEHNRDKIDLQLLRFHAQQLKPYYTCTCSVNSKHVSGGMTRDW